MHQLAYLSDPNAFSDADGLMTSHGRRAAEEAAARAERSREIGNHLRFCHWRQVARLIDALSVQRAFGTVH
ncbi:MAG TPA: hypothetical protein VF636_03145 [Sphingomonas sp.]|jgi:hypothetical protein